jgi:hypothetical protein
MKDVESLKDYIFECCLFLNITVEELENDVYRLIIPENLIIDFIEENIDITFYKTEKLHLTYVTLESYLLQKLSKLILKANNGIASTMRIFKIDKVKDKFLKSILENEQVTFEESYYVEEDFLILWLKLSIRANMLEEYMITYKYNFKTEAIELLKGFSIDKISNLEDIIIDNYSNDEIQSVVSNIMFNAQDIIISFVSKKQDEYNKIMNNEVDRINEHYNNLEQEKVNKQSEDDDLENIINEKDNLIEQQYIKYNINYNQVSLEVISLLLVRQKIEEQHVKIISSNGEKNIILKAIENTT